MNNIFNHFNYLNLNSKTIVLQFDKSCVYSYFKRIYYIALQYFKKKNQTSYQQNIPNCILFHIQTKNVKTFILNFIFYFYYLIENYHFEGIYQRGKKYTKF